MLTTSRVDTLPISKHHQAMSRCSVMDGCMSHTHAKPYTSLVDGQVEMTQGRVRVVPDKVCHISNVHAHPKVAAGKGLDRQGVIQISGCGGVYAEQPAATPAG